VTYPKTGDLMVDDKYLFEVGGKAILGQDHN
jgi:hypothetical protein